MHIPVLTNEIINYLRPEAGGTFIDATVGMGGHAEALIKAGAGRIIAVDRDSETLLQTSERLTGLPIEFFHASFDQIDKVLTDGSATVDGILMDLGISSDQLDDPSRGFSFMHSGPLDMRMDRSQEISAMDIVQKQSSMELERIIRTYGEERFSRRIANAIVEERRRKTLKTTEELADLIYRTVPKNCRHQRIHPATRTFQALRIMVNNELDILRSAMGKLLPSLKEGGRIAIISFHSLEDRIVKNQFRDWARAGIGRIINKKPIVAEDIEISRNPRSRSAKLRVFEKLQKGKLDEYNNT